MSKKLLGGLLFHVSASMPRTNGHRSCDFSSHGPWPAGPGWGRTWPQVLWHRTLPPNNAIYTGHGDPGPHEYGGSDPLPQRCRAPVRVQIWTAPRRKALCRFPKHPPEGRGSVLQHERSSSEGWCGQRTKFGCLQVSTAMQSNFISLFLLVWPVFLAINLGGAC